MEPFLNSQPYQLNTSIAFILYELLGRPKSMPIIILRSLFPYMIEALKR